MLHGFLGALADTALALVAWWAPVAYVVVAGVITHKVAGDNERARNWMVGLFVAVFILLVLALAGWPQVADA